ncbi:phosphate/phosphite/phosphonate ABC transporter substrate-binding protein [Roseomonas chloroacetimidivorans]|uniref:phosphate/phosphite/phosphonate ABC transporter substrate-binding protein n=1 Tax=Roseomonas chloroacetimidivorans TaxID=1766656 RepID=UPI003C794CCB
MLIANARMYAVTPSAAAAWAHLLREVSERAGVPMSVLDYPAPLPLEDLWSRLDLGCAFMCGFPFASAGTRPVLLATPVPTRFGAPAYATDFVVRADAGFTTLEETFGHRLAWTVGHSHSGCNAPRHHLLRYRKAGRERLYEETVGPLVTARGVVDAVLDGRADVGPLDAWWHEILKIHEPATAARLRTVATTELAPAPGFVASSGMPRAVSDRLRETLCSLGSRPELALNGFVIREPRDYEVMLRWEQRARDADYPMPA